MEAKERTSENVRAVNRALDLLLAFTREDFELTASELLQRVELSRPTLYRLLYTLETRGFITSSGDPQRFGLGPAIAQLSHVWTGSLNLALLAEPMMRKLWQETRETVAIFVAQDSNRLCLAEMPSPQPLNFKRGVGYTERLAMGASGRAILAFMPDVEQGLDRYLHGMKVDVRKFRAELAVTRERGYAISRNELIDGAVAIAAPFFGAKGVAGSIGIFGPVNRMGEKQVEVWGRAIVAQAGELSRALGLWPDRHPAAGPLAVPDEGPAAAAVKRKPARGGQ
jgi:DNA-binding IclR family transcriptional regulator